MPAVTLSVSSSLGRRPTQQDVYIAESEIRLYGVLDGHGSEGAVISFTVKRELISAFQALQWDSTTEQDLKAIFTNIQAYLEDNDTLDSHMSGTTVALCWFSPDFTKMWSLHVGDSRNVVYNLTTNKIEFETTDHTCDNKTERERVEACGGRIERGVSGGPLRIYKGSLPYPGLVVTRAIGDQVTRKLGVLSSPEAAIHDLSEHSIIVMATDGVWDGCTPQDVISGPIQKWATLAFTDSDTFSAASEIVTLGVDGMDRVGIDDNATCVCLSIKR